MPFFVRSLLLLLAVLPCAARAAENPETLAVEALVAQAGAAGLAADPQWRALLHINRGGTSRDRGRSYVDDARFFLAPTGADDARAELDATIRTLFAASAATGDDAPACRFVARHRWLGERLGQPVPDPQVACPAYAAWRKTINPGRVTLVFPGSYLNSPSSMFGHTLLRIDPPAAETATVWLSRAVSFGAEVGAADGSLPYIWKGLAGGYPGRFQVEPYFGKIQHYGRMENRDLWEYPLTLTPAETAFLVDHLWELQGINFDYYFFDENCSYRLLELLEVARPVLELTREWRFAEAPVNTIRSVREAGAASAPSLRPSAERELRARVADLTVEERRLAMALAADEPALQDPDFLALPAGRQAAVLATAHARIVYQARRKVGRDAAKAKHSLVLLRALNALQRNPEANVVAPPPPESGHRTHRVSLGGGVLAAGGVASGPRQGYTSLAFRPTYHDVLDDVTGYLPGAELEIGDTELRIGEDGDLKLERLDVANVFSLGARDRFFHNWSWRVRGGIERQLLPDLQLHSTRHVEGGGGVAWRVGDVFARLYAEARVEHNGAHDGLLNLALGPAFGLLGQHAHFNWSIDARPLYFADGFARTEARAAAQWQLHADWGLRAEWRWRNAVDGVADTELTDAQLVLHRYF